MLGKIIGGASKALKGLKGAGGAKKAGGKKSKKSDPLKKLQEKLAKATSPEQVNKIKDKLLKKLQEAGKLTPELKQQIEQMASQRVQALQGGGQQAA